MDEARLELIESLAQRIIINMTHFTKPEYREHIDDEDSWIGSIDTVTKALPMLIQLYDEVCSEEVLENLDDEDNTILRRGFFRSTVDASERQESVINRILHNKDIDLHISRAISLAGQLHETIESIGRQKTEMENLVQSHPGQTSELREIERLQEGLIELSSSYSQLKKTLSKSMILVTKTSRKAKKKLKRESKARSKKPRKG